MRGMAIITLRTRIRRWGAAEIKKPGLCRPGLGTDRERTDLQACRLRSQPRPAAPAAKSAQVAGSGGVVFWNGSAVSSWTSAAVRAVLKTLISATLPLDHSPCPPAATLSRKKHRVLLAVKFRAADCNVNCERPLKYPEMVGVAVDPSTVTKMS